MTRGAALAVAAAGLSLAVAAPAASGSTAGAKAALRRCIRATAKTSFASASRARRRARRASAFHAFDVCSAAQDSMDALPITNPIVTADGLLMTADLDLMHYDAYGTLAKLRSARRELRAGTKEARIALRR